MKISYFSIEKEYCKTLLSNPPTTSEALVRDVKINAFCNRLTQRRSLDVYFRQFFKESSHFYTSFSVYSVCVVI